MSIRVILCTIFVLFFTFYAWRNLFASVCASILLMAVMQHPDVRDALKNIGGVQGLNPWNIMMLSILLAWNTWRRREGLEWDMPRNIRNLLVVYCLVVVWSAFRLLLNVSEIPAEYGFTFGSVISEDIINCLKWILPCVILFDICRTRRQLVVGLLVVLGLYLALALQVIKHIPPSYALSDDFQHLSYKLVQNETGYNRVTLSMMLGGASWALLAMLGLAEKTAHRWVIFSVAGMIAYGQALTGGRSGYVSWGAVGLILCVVRWRKLLPVIPTVIVAICVFFPQIRDRMMHGIGVGDQATDTYEMTSGRNIAWPYVIAQIKEGPILGFGREAMITTGVYQKILDDTQDTESFPHPHNAYLQLLLDDGLLGFSLIIPFYWVVLRCSFRLFRDHSDHLFEAAGGVCCALVLALMVAGMGGETFYPREGAVGMWAAIGIMLRVHVERNRSIETGRPLFGEEEGNADGTELVERMEGVETAV